MLGKKSSEYRAKKRFLYSHEYRTNKMRGKKRVKQFFLKHTNRATKQVGKKIVGKKCEKAFFIFAQ